MEGNKRRLRHSERTGGNTRVSVTQEQLEKHKAGGALSEEQVVETLVIANKLGLMNRQP